MKFGPFTGRYVFHCHILEHEDYDMMRPFEVVERKCSCRVSVIVVVNVKTLIIAMKEKEGRKQLFKEGSCSLPSLE